MPLQVSSSVGVTTHTPVKRGLVKQHLSSAVVEAWFVSASNDVAAIPAPMTATQSNTTRIVRVMVAPPIMVLPRQHTPLNAAE